MELKNKVVLVTGGAIGIGESIVSAFAKKGAKVVINYNRSEKEAEKLVKEIESRKGVAVAIKADVSKESDIKELFRKSVKKFGNIDILVNNASYSKSEDYLKGGRELWQDQFTNNFLSVVTASQEFLKLNKEKKDKKIINISSIYGFGGDCDTSFMQYGASKGALNNFTQSLAKFAAPILVNAVAPGYVWTPQWYGTSGQSKAKFAKELLINRFIRPEEIASAVIFLAENDAVTGQIITVDGGQTLKF